MDCVVTFNDGRVWHDIKLINGRPFTELPNNLCLGMNIDWFIPYDETVYFVGAIYVVVLNLLWTERYRLEHVILVGVIPGPHEPCENWLPRDNTTHKKRDQLARVP